MNEDNAIWSSGRIFDFCYGSGVKTKPGAKIKGVVAYGSPFRPPRARIIRLQTIMKESLSA
jgi:hypothetical protein